MLRILVVVLAAFIFIAGNAETRSVPAEPPVQPEIKNILPKHEHDAYCEKTTAEPVQIICILDRSGSMASLAEDTIGGYNSFLAKQKENPAAAEVTTVLFDNEYELIADAVNLQEIENLTSEEYYARGTTALLDAVGMTVTNTLGKMESKGICPAKRRVLVMIMTDGLENASREYSKATVKALIEETTKNYDWNYIFMGANMDSVAEASKIGINARNAMNFSADRKGIEDTLERMSEAADEARAQ